MNPVIELMPAPTLDELLPLFGGWPGLVVFDSAKPSHPLGRYSYLSADPVRTFEVTRASYGLDPFVEIRETLAGFEAAVVPGLPPFQGGAAGVLGYELGSCFERLPEVPHDELQIPHLAVGVYDWVIAWDHQERRCWVISTGFPEIEPSLRQQRARDRANRVITAIAPQGTIGGADSPRRHGGTENPGGGKRSLQAVPSIPETLARTSDPGRETTNSIPSVSVSPCLRAESARCELTATTFPAGELPQLGSNFSHESYLTAVERVIEYIRAGDIFQANLAQRLIYPSDEAPLDLYRRLRRCNPAPFAGYFSRDDWAIASASPERFLQLVDGVAETRPIKGTRRRLPNPELDLRVKDELHESEKDLAENRMIVDLLRNDLSRVCRAGTIRVPQLCEVETYETVQHLVSVVQGQLRDGLDAWDLLEATFPGGSITGAPKVRAMEIIAELEQVARGPYCGSLFYVGFDGRCDSSILIRTFVVRRGWVQCSVGGGVTIQSKPEDEYRETLHKAAGMLRVWSQESSRGAAR